MGEDELVHRSCSEHIPIEVWSRWSRRWCKYHISNDVFSRCKSVHKMATGKSDDELIQFDNKMRIGTRSGKFITVDGP